MRHPNRILRSVVGILVFITVQYGNEAKTPATDSGYFTVSPPVSNTTQWGSNGQSSSFVETSSASNFTNLILRFR
ncbi:MAG TPA: hypothetical protein VNW51_01920 [Mucilaginibacter sp.]|jgi:hypothetical protein|nr:hypothetical protein [Mucilaginibacter sp.]